MTNSILNNFIFYNYKKFDSEVDSYNPLTTNLPSAGRRVGHTVSDLKKKCMEEIFFSLFTL